jgi:DNA-binding CsgD family transcriptional regulator
MGRSSHLRLSDINAAHRIVNECRELWADPAGWREHLVTQTSVLTGMAVVHYAEFEIGGKHCSSRPLCRTATGWRDKTARSAFEAAAAAHPNTLKFFPGFDRFMPRLLCGKQIVARRKELCADAPWYDSVVFNEFRRPAHLDDNAISAIHRGNGTITVLDVSQDVADACSTPRTKRQLAMLHRLIEPLVGCELATDGQHSVDGLSPQLRSTLTHLLAGDSEKEIAGHLGVRPTTVHEYVGKIYRHFRASSRAELMAYFIKRRPAPRKADQR